MAFDASGTFTRTAGSGDDGATVWQDDAAAGTRILASRHDTHDQDLASGLSQCLTRHGWGVPSVDIPWGGKRITNLGEPIAQQDAATKHYVDNPDAATTSRAINGADLDGRLNFTALSGTNGITWTYADLSWVARHSVPGEANDRLVLASTVAPDTTGPAAGLADVFVIDDAGRINSAAGRLTRNVSYEGAATRTISPGFATILSFADGTFAVSSNDTATITNNYASVTARQFFTVTNGAGAVTFTTDMSSASPTTVAQWSSTKDNAGRWLLRMGNGTAESGTAVGSDFDLHAYNNTGGYVGRAMLIDRATLKVTFGGDVLSGPGYFIGGVNAHVVLAPGIAGTVYLRPNGRDSQVGETNIGPTGAMNVGGPVGAVGMITGAHLTSTSGYFQSTAGLAVLGCGSGIVYLRPNGITNATGQAYVTTAGDWNVSGGCNISGGAVAGQNGITLNAGGFGDFARTNANGAGHVRFINGNGVIGSVTTRADLNGVLYNQTSDERLKDVRGDYDADAAIAIIRADPVKSFTWKSNGMTAIGWLAQRSYAVDKNLASPPEMDADGRQVDENDRWGIDYGARTPYLWAALAAALDKIDALTTRIEALEAA